jgi:hypothetical protein
VHVYNSSYVGGLQSEVSLAKSARPYLKHDLKQEGLVSWLKWLSACFASTKIKEFGHFNE